MNIFKILAIIQNHERRISMNTLRTKNNDGLLYKQGQYKL